MRGIKYILRFKLNNGDYKIIENIDMIEILEIIKKLMIEEYNINDTMYNINNQIVYNIKNHRNVSKLIKPLIQVEIYHNKIN